MDGSTDMALCDSEPIHIPGSIQPHGMLLVATRDRLVLVQAAGDIETRLGVSDWQGAPIGSLVGAVLAERLLAYAEAPDGDPVYIGKLHTPGGLLDVSAHLTGFADLSDGRRDTNLIAVELEPALEEGAPHLDVLERRAVTFRRAQNLEALYAAAARAFRLLTQFDRVLVYKFNSDDSGQVVAEDLAPDLPSFLDHHFPASDIPRQARALYIRNLSRAIPDIGYAPASLRPTMPGVPVDLRDCALRSVSPLHLKYMANMGMRASASFSLVREGKLWGLIACHNQMPKQMGYDVRSAGRLLAGILSREIRAKQEAESYCQALRLRGFEDDILRLLAGDDPLEVALIRHITVIRQALEADGIAIAYHNRIVREGVCPTDLQILDLVAWLAQGTDGMRATDRLAELYPDAREFESRSAGMVGILLSTDQRFAIIWFRTEEVEVMRWAGNPHLKHAAEEADLLNPRKSFAEWVETVRGRSRRWSVAETKAAGRLREALLEMQRVRIMDQLNRRLAEVQRDRAQFLQQNEFLVNELKHGRLTSFDLVSQMLAIQTGEYQCDAARAALVAAGRRVRAIAMVNRRLYQDNLIDRIDARRFVEELCSDTIAAMGEMWRKHISLDLDPIGISTSRAALMGLVLTELMFNVKKHAYGGHPGRLEIRLATGPVGFQLSVTDHGRGTEHHKDADGLGLRLMRTLVDRLGGELLLENNFPGVRAILVADVNATIDNLRWQ